MSSVLSIAGAVLLSGFALIGPGLGWSDALGIGKETGLAERIIVAVGLSAVIMPLVTFWLSLAGGMPVNRLSVALVAIGLTAAPIAYHRWRHKRLNPQAALKHNTVVE